MAVFGGSDLETPKDIHFPHTMKTVYLRLENGSPIEKILGSSNAFK
jgi:hypothetical protein